MGDVFAVPIDDERVGYGQVVGRYEEQLYYFALYECAYRRTEPPALSEVVAQRVALLGLSFDVKLEAGDWQVVGHERVPSHIPLPAYKVSTSVTDRGDLRYEVVDYTGRRRRIATPTEISRLPYRKTVAPVRLERAFRALHGVGPWTTAYDDLRPNPDQSFTSARLFGN